VVVLKGRLGRRAEREREREGEMRGRKGTDEDSLPLTRSFFLRTSFLPCSP
jgi:hypothetical protein